MNLNILDLFSDNFGAMKSQHLLREKLFASGPALPQIFSPLSGHSAGAAFFNSDYSSLYRALQDLGVGIWCQFPHSPFHWMYEFTLSKDMALGYHAFGTSSSMNFFIGLAQWIQSRGATSYADAIEDKRSSLMGRLSQVKSGLLAGAGISFAAFRPISMINAVKDNPSTSLMGRLSTQFVMAGLSFYALFFSVFTGIFGIKIYEGNKLLRKLEQTDDVSEQIGILQKKLQVKPSRVQEKLIAKHGEKKARQILIDEALDVGKAKLRETMKELGIKGVSEELLIDIVKETVLSGLWSKGQLEDKLMQIGLQMKVQKAHLRKSGKMKRVLGQAGFAALCEVKGLAGRVGKSDSKAIALVEKIKDSAKKIITENALVLSVIVLSAAAMVAAMVCTAGIPLIASSALMLVASLAMIVVDGYYLLESYREERPAKYDKPMLIISSFVGLSTILSLVGTSALGFVTFGLFPIVVATTLSILWLAQNGVTWLVMNKAEKRFEELFPTLESFVAALKKGEEKERIDKMLQNLPKESRDEIYKELKKTDWNMLAASAVALERVENKKAAQLELLRKALLPHLVKETSS